MSEWIELPRLQSLNLGDNAFATCHSVVIESREENRSDPLDLNQLQSIELGVGVLAGDSSDTRKTIQQAPYNYNNTLIMRSREEIDCSFPRSSSVGCIQRKRIQLYLRRFSDS